MEQTALNPEDLEILLRLAQPIYAESRSIEKMTSENPVLNGSFDDGSSKIKRGLEQIQRNVQSQVPSRPPTYQPPPQIQNNPPPEIILPPPNPIPDMDITSAIMEDSNDGQMEFNFDLAEVKITNDLLRGINSKLSTIIQLLQTKNDKKRVKDNNSDKGV
jgi:hypothetical protein